MGRLTYILCSSLTNYSELHPSLPVHFKMYSLPVSLSKVCRNLVSINSHFLCGLFLFILKYSDDWFSAIEDEGILILFSISLFLLYYLYFFKLHVLNSTLELWFLQLFSANFVFRCMTHYQSFFLISVSLILELMSIYSCGFHWVAFVFQKEKFVDVLFWVIAYLRCLFSLYLRSVWL